MFKTLLAKISRYRKVRALVSAIRKHNAPEVARLIDLGAPLDGWKAKGPYWITPGHIHAPPSRMTRDGAIELAVECGCDEAVFSVLLSARAHIPDAYGDPSLGRTRWARCERRHQSMKGRGSMSKRMGVCEMVEKSWQAAQLEDATPQSTAVMARPRL